MADPVRILHCHSTFSLGGKEARAVRIMNDFGPRARHSVVSAMPDHLGARAAIDPDVAVDFPGDAPSLTGKPGVARMRALANYMRRFELVLSYNWGALDAVAAHRLAPRGLPPIVHHEDGFNEDEAVKLNPWRNFYRRIAFPTLAALVVPSERLERIALDVWKQPPGRIRRIANGVSTDRYDRPEPGAIPGFERRGDDVVIGTVAGLRAVKDLPRLVRALADLPPDVRLVIVGEGPERAAIMTEAARLGVADRVLIPGFLAEPWRYVGLFDIFALSSKSEQFPISLVEAMAAGLPVVAPDVGDVAAMVAEANRALIGDDLATALDRLARDRDLRRSLGAANREKACAEYDERRMLAEYRALYGTIIGDSRLFER